MIPPDAHEGSAVLMGSQRKQEHILVALDAATYNVRKATCGSICFYCDGYDSAFVDPFPFAVAVGGSLQESLLLDWDDGVSETDFTGGATWSTDNTNVMTVSGGLVYGISPGTANISASVGNETVYNSDYCCESCLYCDSEPFSAGSPGTAVSVAGVLTANDNFSGRSTTNFGIAEVINLSFSTNPSGTPATSLGGLQWTIVSGGGMLSKLVQPALRHTRRRHHQLRSS